MNRLFACLAVYAPVCSGVLLSCTPLAASTELAEMFGGQEFVSIATGREQPLRSAPAVATVITADDIEATGATSLGEILDLVPGFNSLYRFQGDQYVIRGIRTQGNLSPDVLIMIDGVPQNDIHLANQRRFISEIPLYVIARVEVIRGPYSTLYGTDAFSGVVNIITKPVSAVGRSRIGARAGSFKTWEGRWMQRVPLGEGLLFSGQVRSTQGHEPYFERDSQTRLDELFGTDVSRAPSNANTDFDDYSLMLDYAKQDWRLRFRTRGRQAGLGIGLLGAFDPDGQVYDQQYNLEAHYVNRHRQDWEQHFNISALQYAVNTRDVMAYPPGVAFAGSSGLTVFPDGVQDNPGYKERHLRLDSASYYDGLRNHSLQLGLGAEFAEVFDVEETRNYLADPATGLPVTPLPGLINVPQDQLFSVPASRTLGFAYLQDEWNLLPDWTLTSGLRYDYYSDVGGTLNPRLALVWASSATVTTKLLAGRGFRAPTFFELYAKSNPSTLGNKDLKPVTISSAELAVSVRPNTALSWGLSLFYYEVDNIVIYELVVPSGREAKNATGQDGYGLELNAQWDPSARWRLSGYYAFQDNERYDTQDNNSLSAKDKIKLRADWRMSQRWRFNGVVTYVGKRERMAGDDRGEPDNFVITDINALADLNRQITLGVLLKNVFDEEAVALGEPGSGDIALAGRAAYFSLTYDY